MTAIAVAGCPQPRSWNSWYILFSVFSLKNLKDRAARLVDALTVSLPNKWEPGSRKVSQGSEYQMGRYHGYGAIRRFRCTFYLRIAESKVPERAVDLVSGFSVYPYPYPVATASSRKALYHFGG